MKRTNEQNARFHKLLALRRFDKEDKAELVRVITNGRSTSSKDMTAHEMQLAINRLQDEQDSSMKKMRSKIYNVARDIFGLGKDEWLQMHYDAVDKFMNRLYKKPLKDLDYDQTRNAVTAMEKWRDSKTKEVVNNLLNAV